ncbi:MAG: DinB family protein [Anaerolineae bacterium]|nr:DinB family protein [Anaerolineae bacterium]
MSDEARSYLIRQLETAWKLTLFHLDGLTTEECLWRPAQQGLYVHQHPDGRWYADWPEREEYDIGPPGIAWLTWHLGFWWSMVLNHSFGDGTLTREQVLWPGHADGVREWLNQLQNEWRTAIEPMTADELRSHQRTRWPFSDRPFGDVIAWVNVELVKNAAEIGYARFLYAVQPHLLLTDISSAGTPQVEE